MGHFRSTILSNYPSNWTKSALQLCPCPKPQLHNRALLNLDLSSIIIIWVVCLFFGGFELYGHLHSGSHSNPNDPKNHPSNWTKSALQLCPCPKPQLHNRALSNLDLSSIIIIWVVCLFELGFELYGLLHSGLLGNPNAPKKQFHLTILSSNWT